MFAAGNGTEELTSYENASISKLISARILRIIEVASGRETIVDASSIVDARTQCGADAPSPANQTVSLLPKGSNNKVFVVGANDTLLLGIVGRTYVDLIRLADGGASCAGTLGFFGKIGAWALTRDAKSLLGLDTASGAQWSVDESIAHARGKLPQRRAAGRSSLRCWPERDDPGSRGKPVRLDRGVASSDGADRVVQRRAVIPDGDCACALIARWACWNQWFSNAWRAQRPMQTGCALAIRRGEEQ